MGTLYEYSSNFQILYDMVDNEEVEFEDVKDTLDSLEGAIEDKMENIAKLIKEFNGKVEVFKSEEKRLTSRRKTFENKISGLKEYMLSSLDVIGKAKVEAGTFTIRKQKNPTSVNVHNEKIIPSKYFTTQEPVLNKTLLKEDVVKKGLNVSGAGLAPESYHVRIG